jgi:hypothetical protein
MNSLKATKGVVIGLLIHFTDIPKYPAMEFRAH